MEGTRGMQPIGPLMIEHRLIERMVDLLHDEITSIQDSNEVNTNFIETAF